jgi:gliding motility-associated-like protein
LGVAFTDSLILYPANRNAPDHLLLKTAIKETEPIGAPWQKISGCFLATSASQYMLIGNFNSIDSTKIVRVTNGFADASAYYFIDDVLVEELPYDVSALAATATLCAGEDFVQLNAFVAGAENYEWHAGAQGPTLNVSTKGDASYSVDISFAECQYKHAFQVTYVPDIDLGVDTILCAGEELRLAPTHPTSEFLWSDGSSDSVKYISTPGTYAVSIPTGNCNIQDSIAVSVIDCPGFVPNIITPNKDPYNEYFVIENIENRSWSLIVFNKWGEQVYFSAHYENGWSGSELPDGVYYYKLSSSELGRTVKGWVQLVH